MFHSYNEDSRCSLDSGFCTAARGYSQGSLLFLLHHPWFGFHPYHSALMTAKRFFHL